MKSKKNIAVILSGCGRADGSEITESVSTLIALSKAGANYMCFAPDLQIPESNHYDSSHNSNLTRNVLHESARIARGQIKNLKDLNSADFDGLIFPGGFGAAKNLSNWASAGAKAKAHPDVEKAILSFYKASKPIGAICIAPTLLALTLGKENPTLTVGARGEAAVEIEKTGAVHEACPVEDFITDREHKLVTTPAYMYDEANPYQVFKGISGLCQELVEMA